MGHQPMGQEKEAAAEEVELRSPETSVLQWACREGL